MLEQAKRSHILVEKMIKQSEDQIVSHIIQNFNAKKLTLLAPIIKGRKGHYRELFQQIAKQGFTKVRVNGTIEEISPKMQLDRYKTHDIEIVIDRIIPKEEDRFRISQSVQTALKHGQGVIMVLTESNETIHFSKFLMDPENGLSYDEPAPNTFSFNSAYGACPCCNGLGIIEEITKESVIPDKELSIYKGGIAPLGEFRDIWIFKQLEVILKSNKFTLFYANKRFTQRTD